MIGINRFVSRLPLSVSSLRLYQRQNVIPVSFHRHGVPLTSTLPRTSLLYQKQTNRNYTSWEDDDKNSTILYPDSNEDSAFQRWERNTRHSDNYQNSSRPRTRYSSSRRHPHSRSPNSSFIGRQRGRNFDDDDDDFYNFGGRFQSQELGANIKKKDWNKSVLTSIEKNFYVLHPDVAEKSKEAVDEFYTTHNITISQGDRPIPLSDFHEANFPEKIVRYFERNDWSNPTPIQSLGWPIALSGKNLVGIAQTGSGKTLGFILPALVHIKHQRPVNRGDGPIVLVLAPTRELAQQIKGVAVEYGRLLGIRSCSIFGGQSKMIQARNLSHGPELVVATPGRLIDFLESEVIDLDRTTYVVLDEADRMLDMGFEPQIRKVLDQIRPDRQILMWSATWPKEIQQLAHDFLGEFTQVNIGSQELTANPNIQQVVKVCEWREKFKMLLHELKSQLAESEDRKMPKTLIFGQTKRTVDFLASKLRNSRIKVRAIHGDKSQLFRDTTLQSFRDGETDILVATDVAARGLDVDDIKVVINYDYPNCIDDYIHRIGRTARASKTGKAISFITDDDAGKVKDLILTLKSAQQEVDPELYDLAKFHTKFSKKSSPRQRSNFSNRKPSRTRSLSRFDDRYSW